MAEGTPEELKHSIGTDVIITRIDGDANLARDAVVSIPKVQQVEAHDNELIISVTNGAELISSVALALNA